MGDNRLLEWLLPGDVEGVPEAAGPVALLMLCSVVCGSGQSDPEAEPSSTELSGNDSLVRPWGLSCMFTEVLFGAVGSGDCKEHHPCRR